MASWFPYFRSSYLGSFNKIPQIERLKQQKFIISQSGGYLSKFPPLIRTLVRLHKFCALGLGFHIILELIDIDNNIVGNRRKKVGIEKDKEGPIYGDRWFDFSGVHTI